MPLPDSVTARLDHAKLHLDLLYAECNGYIRSNPGEMVPNPDSEPNNPTFVYRQREPVPPRISLLVGDCLQNLRSAFDYLIWELVLAAGNEPTKRNMFPVCLSCESLEDAKRGKRLQGIVDRSEALIDELQPCAYVQPAQHWLAILDDLCNINKHRRLLLAALSGFSMSGLMADLDRMTTCKEAEFSHVIHDTQRAKIFTAEQVKMQGDTIAFVAFNERAVKEMEVGILAETYIGVVRDALAPFGQFFG